MSSLHRHSYGYRHWRLSKTVADPRGEMEEQSAREGQMVSIIEYSTEKKARNSYPHKIISPPIPSRCCQARMNRVGSIQAEGDNKFYYKRCSRCGFTVREFVSTTDIDHVPSLGVSASDRTERWIDQIQREVQSDIAA